MKVKVPACAPTTPPETGASTNSEGEDRTEAPTAREVAMSMVEQSMKSLWVRGGVEKIEVKTLLTCCGSGSMVIMVSWVG